jgi:predicted restriction endonuclease
MRHFRAQTAGMPRETEAQRWAVERVGQSLFRQALIEYWNGRCPLTGITELPLLRASHIVPWAECETDMLRLDVHNGLLLSALWDAAFDSGLVSFADSGAILYSTKLGPAAAVLTLTRPMALLGLTDIHCGNLARHRIRHGYY